MDGGSQVDGGCTVRTRASGAPARDAGPEGSRSARRYSRRVPFQALYRKYRPQRFSELVDQDHVVGALRTAVRDGRVGHAYLLSGPRGTGKTTTARILAKALNCTQLGDDGEPCGECANCRAIAAGTFLDLFELDAASNRGIENIRDVIESASLGLGPEARTKVYVLDEVHMLTDAASNALLKTLEEAPGHVVFVLATTNPEKVLPTIRSRTQHLEFNLIRTDDLAARLAMLCEREGVAADPEALDVIATAAAGSARDAESLLDQALAHGADRLDAGAIAELFGGTAFDARLAMLEAIAAEDATGALVGLAELLESGHEPRRVAEDLLAAARDAFLLTAARGRVSVAVPADAQERLASVGDALGSAALVRVIETLGQAIADMRGVEAADPRLVLEVALVRLSRREAGPPIQTVIERIERLERAQAMQPGASDATSSPPAAGPAARRSRPTVGALRREAVANGAQVPTPEPVPAQAPDADGPSATPSAVGPASGAALELDDLILAWGAIVPDLPPATRSAVQNAQPVDYDGEVVVFGVAPELLAAARERFKREADNVRDALAAKLGRRFKFTLVAAPELSLSVSRTAAAVAPDDASPPDDEPPPDLVSDAEPALPASEPPPVSRLRQELGATVVEELPRES
jgi:DNA polymerase-3 subunit gamma/tau